MTTTDRKSTLFLLRKELAEAKDEIEALEEECEELRSLNEDRDDLLKKIEELQELESSREETDDLLRKIEELEDVVYSFGCDTEKLEDLLEGLRTKANPDPSQDYAVWDTWRQIDALLQDLAETRRKKSG